MDLTTTRPARVALIGCGNIAGRYVDGMARFPGLLVTACADAFPEVAQRFAAEHGLRAHDDIDALLADPEIDVVVNITPPTVHAEVTLKALAAGKHVYVEKPFTATTDEARTVLAAAQNSTARIGAAPDTFLGSAAQTARAALDEGRIGEPVAATAFVRSSQVESWHPDPTFLFKPGGGPGLDLGPYYVTALVNLLGPVESVAGFTRVGAPERPVTAPGRRVESITVETTTHQAATIRFVSGAVLTLMMSFDVWHTDLPWIEVYGTQGTLSVSDPNSYDGPVRLRRNGDADWTLLEPVLPVTGPDDGPEQYLRGIGVDELVRSLSGTENRVSPELSVHVLEVLEAIETASSTRSVVTTTTRPGRPAAVETTKEPLGV